MPPPNSEHQCPETSSPSILNTGKTKQLLFGKFHKHRNVAWETVRKGSGKQTKGGQLLLLLSLLTAFHYPVAFLSLQTESVAAQDCQASLDMPDDWFVPRGSKITCATPSVVDKWLKLYLIIKYLLFIIL